MSSTDRRGRLLAVAAMAATLVAAGCTESGGASSTTTDAASEETPIIIGMPAERTGPTATPSSLGADGAALAVEQLNEDGGVLGRPVELLEIDTEGDGANAVQATRDLADRGAVAIVGPVSGSLCAAVTPTLNELQLPGVCLTPADLPTDDSYVFGMGVALEQVNVRSWERLGEANAKVGVLVPTTPVGELHAKHASTMTPAGVELVEQSIAPDDTTARPQLQALIDEEVGGLFIAHCGPISITAAREAIDLGFDGKIVLYNCFASETAAESIAGFTNGQVETFAPQFILGDVAEDDPQREAIERYGAAGGEPDIVMAVGWDGVMMMAAAIEAAGSTGSAAIVAAIEDGLVYDGVWSANEFGADDHRGARVEGALIPARFTAEGAIEPADEG